MSQTRKQKEGSKAWLELEARTTEVQRTTSGVGSEVDWLGTMSSKGTSKERKQNDVI